MKKQYVFITMIFIIFLILYYIVTYTYNEYKINSSINYIKNITKELEEKIDTTKKVIEYKNSKAYKNKIIKEQQSFKNIWETVVFLTTEENFNKYTTVKEEKKEEIEKIVTEDNIEVKIKDLSIYEKWMYFLFKSHPDPEYKK